MKKLVGTVLCALSLSLVAAQDDSAQTSTWAVLQNAPVVQALNVEERNNLEGLCNSLDSMNDEMKAIGLAKLEAVFKAHEAGYEVLKNIAKADAFGLIIQCVPLKMDDSGDDLRDEEVCSLEAEDSLDEEL